MVWALAVFPPGIWQMVTKGSLLPLPGGSGVRPGVTVGGMVGVLVSVGVGVLVAVLVGVMVAVLVAEVPLCGVVPSV